MDFFRKGHLAKATLSLESSIVHSDSEKVRGILLDRILHDYRLCYLLYDLGRAPQEAPISTAITFTLKRCVIPFAA